VHTMLESGIRGKRPFGHASVSIVVLMLVYQCYYKLEQNNGDLKSLINSILRLSLHDAPSAKAFRFSSTSTSTHGSDPNPS
jgi:hypothetical protein